MAASPATGSTNTTITFLGPWGRLWVRQSLSAVTGACLLVSREAMRRVGPLDETRFAIAHNDVDLCLRALAAGYRILWTPFRCARAPRIGFARNACLAASRGDII
jgi:GT2 family glycosyltransferase